MLNIHEELTNLKITGLTKLQSKKLISLAIKNNKLQINVIYNLFNKEIVEKYSMEKINNLSIELIKNELGFGSCFNDSNGVYIDKNLEKEDIESIFDSISDTKLNYILEIDIIKHLFGSVLEQDRIRNNETKYYVYNIKNDILKNHKDLFDILDNNNYVEKNRDNFYGFAEDNEEENEN
jgi:hypothetical protein